MMDHGLDPQGPREIDLLRELIMWYEVQGARAYTALSVEEKAGCLKEGTVQEIKLVIELLRLIFQVQEAMGLNGGTDPWD